MWKRLLAFLLVLLLASCVCAYAKVELTDQQAQELDQILTELENLNKEQSQTLKEQDEVLRKQETAIHDLQRDVEEQQTLLKEEKKSSTKRTITAGSISLIIGFILGALLL